MEINNAFGISARQIEVCSVEEKYHLIDVMDKIVDILPKEKKYAFVREAKEEVVTKESAIAAKKAFGIALRRYQRPYALAGFAALYCIFISTTIVQF